MKNIAVSILCVALSACLFVCAASALSVPERLVYDVSWSGISAGSAVQEVTSRDGELDILYTVRSSGLVNAFFSIDDRTQSVLSRGRATEPFGMPKLFREKINEGKTHTWKEARFDLNTLQVHTKDFLKKTEKTDKVTSTTFDTLSCIYFIRASELIPGKPIYLDIFDLKRLWNAEVRVVKREEINTSLGRFKTLVVKSVLKSEGVPTRTDYMTVWLTDDKLRIPVKLSIKLKMGEFTANLVGGSYWPE
jgi:hypothetical protein